MRLLIFISLLSVLSLEASLYAAADSTAADVQKAEDAALRALASDPNDYRAYSRRAWAAYMRSQYEEAEKDYKKALHHAPPAARPDLFYNLGNTYFMQRNLRAAAESWRSGLRLSPGDADMLYNYTVARRLLLEEEKKQGEKDDESEEKQSGEGESDTGDKEQERQTQEDTQAGNEPQNGKRQSERQNGEMSEEEALRLLRALQEQERQASPKEKAIIGGLRLDKDW